MPITDVWSYVTTGNEFDAHWADVNTDRVANSLTVLTLPDGYLRSSLTADIAALQTALTAVEDLDNARAVATVNRDNAKQALRGRVIEFREAVDFRLKGSGYALAMPDTPHPDASEQKTLKALDDMHSTWTRINADASVPNFAPPLLLRGGYAVAAFTTQLTGLRTNYLTVSTAENDVKIQRRQRDVRLAPLRDRVISYRQAVLVEYGESHPFVSSLPDVYPSPGSTPDAVVLSGEWIPMLFQAQLSWTESTNPNLVAYQLRGCNGPTYNEAESSLIDSYPPGTLTAATLFGLAFPGNQASFKVFVILTTGNQAGSNAVTITRV